MRIYFGVMLGIELDDDVRLEWDDGQRFARDKAGVQLISNEAITERVRELLTEATRHDDTTMWRVVHVLGGNSVEIDGDSTVITDTPARGEGT